MPSSTTHQNWTSLQRGLSAIAELLVKYRVGQKLNHFKSAYISVLAWCCFSEFVQRIFKSGDMQTPVVLPINNLTFWYTVRLFCHHLSELHVFLNGPFLIQPVLLVKSLFSCFSFICIMNETSQKTLMFPCLKRQCMCCRVRWYQPGFRTASIRRLRFANFAFTYSELSLVQFYILLSHVYAFAGC